MLIGADYNLNSTSTRGNYLALSNQPESASHKRLCKAAQEFEGMLISQLLGNFASGMSFPSSGTHLAGADTLNTLAVQTLSTAMAGRGGFGIGKMLVHQLEPKLHR